MFFVSSLDNRGNLDESAVPKAGEALVCSECGGWLMCTGGDPPFRRFTAEDFLTTPDDLLNMMRRATELFKHMQLRKKRTK